MTDKEIEDEEKDKVAKSALHSMVEKQNFIPQPWGETEGYSVMLGTEASVRGNKICKQVVLTMGETTTA